MTAPAEPAPPVSSPFAPTGQDAALVAAFAGEAAPAAEAGPAPPAMLAPMGASPAANGEAVPPGIVAAPVAPGLGEPPGAPAPGPSADDELAASPWNRANNPGLNRDLLPSAMVAAAPEPPPASKKAARPLAPEEPSRAPWIVVGLLVVVAIAGGVGVFMIQSKRGSSDGKIAVPAGQASSNDDIPVDTAAPTATATASAAPKPHATYRPVVPGPLKTTTKPPADDPYSDVPSSGGRIKNPTPSAAPTAAKGRIFGSDPY